MTPKNHNHKFRRDSYSTGKKFYYCINGNCNFKIDTKLSLGKFVHCNGCNEIFQMNEYSIRMAKPKCMSCVKRRTLKESVHADNVAGITNTVSLQTSSVEELKAKINNLTIKEYDPDVDDTEL